MVIVPVPIMVVTVPIVMTVMSMMPVMTMLTVSTVMATVVSSAGFRRTRCRGDSCRGDQSKQDAFHSDAPWVEGLVSVSWPRGLTVIPYCERRANLQVRK